MQQLSVVLARFPFTNQIDYKIRPALIVSNDHFNKLHNFFWVLPITTKTTLKQFEVEIHPSDFSGKLKEKSFVRTDTIAAMEKDLFLKEIGKIDQALFETLKRKISENF